MHFTVQVKRTQHAELHIEAEDVIEAKLVAREMSGDEAFDEADTEYKYSEPFRLFVVNEHRRSNDSPRYS